MMSLQANKVLQTLNFADNKIGDHGAAAFADALKVPAGPLQLRLRLRRR